MSSASAAPSSKAGKSGKLKPNLDKDRSKSINLTVLQRKDQFVEEILTIATHVTLYQFDIDTSQWARKDIEGSLFVVKRSTQPRFQFIVMNRRSEENFVENLLGDFEFENQNPYLMYRNAAQEVIGMWFYNTKECEEIADLFTRLINSYPNVSPGQEATPSRRLFEELGVKPSSAITAGPLEHVVKPAASTLTAHPEDPSIMKFFSGMHINEGLQPDQVHDTHIPASPSPLVSNVHPSPSPLVSNVNPSPSPLLSNVHPSPLPILQVPPSPGIRPVAPTWTLTDRSDLINNSNSTANLVKPSSFIAPSSSPPTSYLVPPISLTPTAYLQSLLKLDHNTPKLPALSPPTTISPVLTEHAPVNRERVKDALLMLTQDNQFVDMVYQALMKVCQP